MTRAEILEGLKEVLGVIRPKADLSAISDGTKLVSDLGIDSLSMMFMSLATEEKFGFHFPPDQAPFETVGQVCDYIEKVK